MGLLTVTNSLPVSTSIASYVHGRSTYIFVLTSIAAVGVYFAKDIANYLLDRAYLSIISINDPQALELCQEAIQTLDITKIDQAL